MNRTTATQNTADANNQRERLGKLLDSMDKATKGGNKKIDRALWHLLKQYENELPDLGDYFHKAFRQADVTGNGHTDMAIWNLLYHSSLFWELFGKDQDENQVNN